MKNLSRVYIASRLKSISSKRVDNRKHGNRPGLGCEGLSSSRTLRYWNFDRICCSRRKQLHGFESWTESTGVQPKRQKPFPLRMRSTEPQETRCQSKTTTEACRDTVFTVRERKWIDVNLERFRQDCFVVWKAMIRSLRHDQSVPREDDGAVRFDDIMEEFKKKFDGALQWPINHWISILPNWGGSKEKVSTLFEP